MYEHENKRDIHARSSSAAHLASPRHDAPREWAEPMSKFLPRTTGIQKVTRKLKNFHDSGVLMRTVQPFGCWMFASSSSLRFTFRRCPLASFSCAYKREVAPLRETHQNYFLLSPPVPKRCAAASIFSIPACGVHRRSGQ